MPEPEPVPEPAPPPPPRECRRRRRSGSSARSRACRAQRRLHLRTGGGRGGGGPGAGGAGRARPQPRNPRPARVPRPRLGVEARGSRLGATPPQPLCAIAPPTGQGRSGGRDPAPCSALGVGGAGAGPERSRWSAAGLSRPRTRQDPSQQRVSGLLLQPGVSRGNGDGAGLRALGPAFYSQAECPAPFLDPWRFRLGNLMGRMIKLSFVPWTGLGKGKGSRIPGFGTRLCNNSSFSFCRWVLHGLLGCLRT